MFGFMVLKSDFFKPFWVLLIFFAYSIAFPQTAYTDKDKNNFYNGIFNGCLDKQKQGEVNRALKDGVTREACACLANQSTNNVFGDIDFQISFSRNDNLGAKKIIDKNLSSENVVAIFNSCIDNLDKKYGGKERLFLDNNIKLSEKIGLTGDSRASFVDSGASACMTEKSGYGRDIDRSYCFCYMNYIADRLSQKDLVEMGKKTTRMRRKSAELREKGIKNCMPIFN